MNLPRPVIWILTGVSLLCLAGFVTSGVLAYSSRGYIHEYEVLGVGLPKVLTTLLLGMAISATLPWAHFRRDAYTAFEETFFAVLLGIAAFGLLLMVPLALAT